MQKFKWPFNANSPYIASLYRAFKIRMGKKRKKKEEKDVFEGDDFSQVLISYIKARLVKHSYKEQQYLILYNKVSVCVCVCKHRGMLVYTHASIHKYKNLFRSKNIKRPYNFTHAVLSSRVSGLYSRRRMANC